MREVHTVRYLDVDTGLSYEEPWIFRRLYSPGQTFIRDYRAFEVLTVTVTGGIQVVRVRDHGLTTCSSLRTLNL